MNTLTPDTPPGSLPRMVLRLRLFLRLVWRRWEETQPGYPAHYACTHRLTIRDAWSIASGVWVRNDQAEPLPPDSAAPQSKEQSNDK